MKDVKPTLGLCCALALATAPALAAEPLIAPVAPTPLATPQAPDGEWVDIGGTVQSVGSRRFVLNAGGAEIPVDMDGYASLDVSPGEWVTVTGRMETPFTGPRLLNASSVTVPARNLTFYANPSDDGDGGYAYSTAPTPAPVPGPAAVPVPAAPLTLTGTVVDARTPDTFTIATGNGTYTVEGREIAATLRQRPILIGDRVSVSGTLGDLFDRRVIDASSVTVLSPNRAL